MLNVYNNYSFGMIALPPFHSLDEVKEFAGIVAKRGVKAFYRVFEQTDESPTGEQFVTSFSVLNGMVREHRDVTIPIEHW